MEFEWGISSRLWTKKPPEADLRWFQVSKIQFLEGKFDSSDCFNTGFGSVNSGLLSRNIFFF